MEKTESNVKATYQGALELQAHGELDDALRLYERALTDPALQDEKILKNSPLLRKVLYLCHKNMGDIHIS